MGCDIHLYVELKEVGASTWHGQHFFIPRLYGLFASMAGVRKYNAKVESFPEKGIPFDLSSDARDSYTRIIDDEYQTDDYHYIKSKQAEEWVKHGLSKYYDNCRVSGPDYHSASWLTLEEFRIAYKRFLDYFMEPITPDILRNRENYAHLTKEECFEIFKRQLESPGEKPVSPVPEVEATIAYMETLEKHKYQTRIVFWFDN